MNKLCCLAILLAISGSALAGSIPVLNSVTGVLQGSAGAVVSSVTQTDPTTLVDAKRLNPSGVQQTLSDTAVMFNGLLYVLGQLVTPQALINTIYLNYLNVLNFNWKDPQSFLDRLLIIGGYDSGSTNSVGAIALPTYSLCGLGEQYKLTSCYICNQDCYVAHNLWGGKCGPSPVNPKAQTCLCSASEEESKNRTTVPSSTTTCDVALTPVGGLTDFVVGLAFRVRSIALQCWRRNETDNTLQRDQSGCVDDCVLNHGYTGGVCVEQYANVANPAYSSSEKNLFCVCTSKNANNETVLSTEGRATPLVSSNTTTTTTTAAPTTTTTEAASQ